MVMQVGEGLSDQLLEKHGVTVNAVIQRCTGKVVSNQGGGSNQRGKPAWFGLRYMYKWGEGWNTGAARGEDEMNSFSRAIIQDVREK